jgi:precorrin-2 dehydrogenase/sirohydrochlorin ferrochelatase
MVALNLENKSCLVIGGGQIAERKVRILLECGGLVKVVSPQLTTVLAKLAQSGAITHRRGVYKASDLAGAFIVIAATSHNGVNRQVAEDCRKYNLLVNVVDDPSSANFFVPATVRRGSLQIAVSTGGKSPLLARRIREELEELYGDIFEEFIDFLGGVRDRIITDVADPGQRSLLLRNLIDPETLSLLREGHLDRAKERVQKKCLL